MADPQPPTSPDVDMVRVRRAEAFIARYRDRYDEEALRRRLRAAGYSEAEVALALGRAQGADPPKRSGLGSAFAVGIMMAMLNLVLFPLAMLWANDAAAPGDPAPLIWVTLGLILVAELGLAYLLNRRSLTGSTWVLALLAPIAAHLLFFGLCLSRVLW